MDSPCEDRCIDAYQAWFTLRDVACVVKQSALEVIERELLERMKFDSRATTRLCCIYYIVDFYRSKRLDPSLDYLSPVEFERQHQ